MRRVRITGALAFAALALAATYTSRAAAQSTAVTFENFNTGEGRFVSSPGASGSSNGFQKNLIEYPAPAPLPEERPNPSTAVHDTTQSADGPGGSQRIDLFDDLFPAADPTAPLTPNGGTARLRNLSGGGGANPALPTFTNTQFTTSGGDAVDDGWIGVAIKTDSPGWTTQIYIESSPNTAPTVPGEHNGSVPKEIIADNEWHVYQWSLDDFTGGPDGWGSIAGIIGNGDSIAIIDGAHTIDSILFRTADFTQTPIVEGVRKATFYMDFVTKSATGQITLPEPEIGDFNNDGLVNDDDFNDPVNGFKARFGADLTGEDFLLWQRNYGHPGAVGAAQGVPEPASVTLAGLALAGLAAMRRRRVG